MPTIIYVDAEGTEQKVEAVSGETVMETAVKHGVEWIAAECGGACACATCHVYVDDAFAEMVGPPGDMEQSMLEFTDEMRPNSRLSCQVKVADELDGLRVVIPDNQD